MENDGRKVRPLRPKEEDNKEQCSEKDKVTVVANHFPVNFEEWFPATIYHYDVDITSNRQGGNRALPEESSVPDRLLLQIWKEFEEEHCEYQSLGVRCLPFDLKKNCYTARRLHFKNDSDVFVFVLPMIDPEDADRIREYRITLKLVKEIPTSGIREYLLSSTNRERVPLPQEVIQALDVVLRYCPVTKRPSSGSVDGLCIPYNRSFYSSTGAPKISELIDLWFGHNQSLLLGRNPNQATLNIDMANKAFTKELRLDEAFRYILNLKKGQDIPESRHWKKNDVRIRTTNNFLKGKLIKYEWVDLNGNKTVYTFVANGVAVKADVVQNSDYPFLPRGKDREYTIGEFFQERGFPIEHPEWPVIHVGKKTLTNYIPLEICHIVPQAYKGKLTTAETTNMIQEAAKRPKERFKRIQDSRNGGNFDCPDILKDFGMSVQKEMIEIKDARILTQPTMQYKDNKGTTVEKIPPNQDGKFKVDRLLEGAKIHKVGLLNLSWAKADLKWRFMEKLGRKAEEVGLESGISGKTVSDLFKKLNVKEAVVTAKPQQRNFSDNVRLALEQLKEKNCQIVIVIIGDEGREYSCVKFEAEISVGILTQCVKQKTVWKAGKDNAHQLLFNILLKMNVKLNGKNFTLGQKIQNNYEFESEPILFLGADVTHPAPGSNSRSVAAITASYDRTGACYQMHIQVQEAGQEEIDNFRKVLVEMLDKYQRDTGTCPSRIIMFRDGVSEGQFDRIKELEYEKGICAACSDFREWKSLNSNWNPKVTFLVVKKRHHTRFDLCKKDTGKGVKPMGNIPPGTVVDDVITHPNEMEFFLNSHVGIQGTSKPTRYHVIHDDNGFTMEDLEQLTYCLCYTFMRCTQPVSYPAPTYYAHIAAFRARALIEREGVGNVNLKQLQDRMKFNPDLVKKYPMFYI